MEFVKCCEHPQDNSCFQDTQQNYNTPDGVYIYKFSP